MSSVFSNRNPLPISCDQPVLTVSFPKMAPAANTVVLANGAVVDLNQLGAIIAQFCPAIACQPSVIMQGATAAATAGIETMGTAPLLESLPTDLMQMAASIMPSDIAMVQQTFDPMQMAILGSMMGQMG